MHQLENPYPAFIPGDLCRVKGIENSLVMVNEVNCNTCQTKDKHQWSFSVNCLTPNVIKSAWYDMDELILIKNVFDVIANKMAHPFGSKSYKFSVSNSVRRPLFEKKETI